MKIIFVSGNRERLPDPVVPLGLLYIIANTPQRHERKLVDLCFAEDPLNEIVIQLGDFQPDLIAISMRNIQNNDYTGIPDNLSYYAELIAACKNHSKAPVVIGGAGFSVMPGELMQRLRADFGISGEGERAFPKLVDALEHGKSLDGVAGLWLRESNISVRQVPAPPDFLDITQLAIPDRSLIDSRYFRDYGIDSVQTKRGCPLQCNYCTYPIIEGRRGRLREPDSVVDEMFVSIERHPEINHFFIVDSVFNLPKTHAKKICRELIARRWEVPWTCYANPLGFDQEFADLAAEAGCAGMEIGSDSGVDDVLKRLRKGFTVEHIRNLHEICKRASVPDCHTFILGTQGETINDVQQTLAFIEDLDPFSAILMVWTDDYESLNSALREQRLTLRSEINALLIREKDRFPQWSMPGLGINFSETLFDRLRQTGMHGPLWQYMRGPRGIQMRQAIRI